MARSRQRERTLSAEAIIAEAMSFIDQEGLSRLTMRSLAERLGVYPGSLYWHVGSKSRLLSAAAASMFTGVVTNLPSSGSWQQQISVLAHAIRDSMRAHPNLAPIATMEMLLTIDGAVPYIEHLLELFSRAGFTGTDLVHAYNSFNGAVIGWVAMELSREPDADEESDAWRDGYREEMEKLGPLRYPAIAAAMPMLANKAFMLRWESGVGNPLDDSFDALIETLIGGWEASLETAGAPS